MQREKQVRVISIDGAEGSAVLPTGADRPGNDLGLVQVKMNDGRDIRVPVHLLTLQEDGTYQMQVNLAELPGWQNEKTVTSAYVVIPVIEERLSVDKQVSEQGGVRITKQVDTREEVVDEPEIIEEVDVKRVPVNRKQQEPAEPRQEGDTWIIPVMEEVLVVQKQYWVKEEIHITRKKHEVRNPQRVTLRTERVNVERFEGPQTGETKNSQSQD